MDKYRLPSLDRSRVVHEGVLAVKGLRRHSVAALPAGAQLAAEMAALSPLPDLQVWLQVALEYHRIGRGEDFLAVLEESQRLGSEVPDVEQELPRVISALAWHRLLACSGVRGPESRAAREDLLYETSRLVNKASRGDMLEHSLVATTMAAARFWAAEAPSQVRLCMKTLDDEKTHNVASRCLQGILFFQEEKYSEALAVFADVLRAKPDCPASVRFGLGICYFKLGKLSMAEKCYERAIQLDDQLVEPRVALAALKLNSGDLSQVQPAMRLLTEAYKIDDCHPRVLVFFADHYFHRRDYDKLQKLASRARENTDVRRILSEALFQLGRAEHARGNFERARLLYESSVAEDSCNKLAQFGLAQVLLHDGDAVRADTCLDSVIAVEPSDLSTLEMRGIVLARLGRSKEALEHLQKALDSDAGTVGPDTFVEYGLLTEQTDRSKSLSAYRAALKLLLEKKKPELRNRILGVQNNVAVLHHRLGQLAHAEAVYGEIFDDATRSDPEACVAQSVSMSFNLARLWEDVGKLSEAQALHEAILRKHVTYTDCYLRLSAIARAQQRPDDAMKYLADALAVHEDLPDALAMMGNLHVERNELHAAQLKFSRVLEKVDKNDAYALLSLGNIYYMARAEKKERKERNMKHAAESYWKVLHADNFNVYAANGLGMVMAAEGRLGAAGEFFTKVRENTGAMGDVVVNLAHIHLARGEFTKAITLYESALRKHFKNNHPKIMLYLSRAYFEAKEYVRSEEYINRCLGVASLNTDQALRFNLGLILETKTLVFLEHSETPLIDQARAALADVERARAVFFEIHQQGEVSVASTTAADAVEESQPDNDQGEDAAAAAADRKARNAKFLEIVKNSQSHVTACDELIKLVEAKLEKAQAFLLDEATIRKQREERAQERLRAKQEAEERRREAEKAGAAELAAIAEKDMLVLREEMVHWKPLSSGGGGSGSRKGGDGGDGEERKPKKKKEKRSKEIADELASLTPSAKKPTKPSRSSSSGAGREVQQQLQQQQQQQQQQTLAEEEEEEEDELEEWQKARMNPKLSSLVESKRVRDEREKRGGQKRRNVDGDD